MQDPVASCLTELPSGKFLAFDFVSNLEYVQILVRKSEEH